LNLDTVITLPEWWLPLLIGVVTPLLTGLITRVTASPATKAWIGVLLVAALSVIGSIVDADGAFVVRDVVATFVLALVTHQSTYSIEKAMGNGVHPVQKVVPGA
jgi:hypothetical protein